MLNAVLKACILLTTHTEVYKCLSLLHSTKKHEQEICRSSLIQVPLVKQAGAPKGKIIKSFLSLSLTTCMMHVKSSKYIRSPYSPCLLLLLDVIFRS